MESPQYVRSPPQSPYELKDAFGWGRFVRYIEFGEDAFAVRQVDVYENGWSTCYDRQHWEDQFGSLADFRFGLTWVKHWGEPDLITREEFEARWKEAAGSPPYQMRRAAPVRPPPWITLYESGKWKGQA